MKTNDVTNRLAKQVRRDIGDILVAFPDMLECLFSKRTREGNTVDLKKTRLDIDYLGIHFARIFTMNLSLQDLESFDNDQQKIIIEKCSGLMKNFKEFLEKECSDMTEKELH